jgi:hypothetical protein
MRIKEELRKRRESKLKLPQDDFKEQFENEIKILGEEIKRSKS